MEQIANLTDVQKRLLDNYDPALREAGLSTLLDLIITRIKESHSASASDPVNAVASTLTTALAGDNNDLVFTAKTKGVIGDSITVAYVDPGGVTAELGVVVTGTTIVVNLGRTSSAIDTTATALKAAIEATPAAAALVSVANSGSDTGAGLVTEMDETALDNGVDGTEGLGGDTITTTSKLWTCTADNTTADANWKYVSLT